MQSERVQAFLKEIADVCGKHGLLLTVSGYDRFQVWTLDTSDPKEFEQLLAASDETPGYEP
jgi:hypothetical protein